MNLLDKIEELRTTHRDPYDKSIIDSWYEDARRFLLIASAAENEGVKLLLAIWQVEVDGINQKLLEADSLELPDAQRDRMIDRRAFIQQQLDLFTRNQNSLDALTKTVISER